MTNHRMRRSIRAVGLVGCTALVMAGCVRGGTGEVPHPSPSAPGPATASPKAKLDPPSLSPTPSPSPSLSPPVPPRPPSAPEGRVHRAYADVALTTPTSTFTSPIDLATTLAMRRVPATPGAVGTATVYMAAFRDGIVTGDPSVMQTLALPECSGCAAITDSIKTLSTLSGEVQLTSVVWVLGVVEEPEGSTLVTVGVESISTAPGPARDGQATTETMLYLWDIQLEDTPDGWAVQGVTTRPWT